MAPPHGLRPSDAATLADCPLHLQVEALEGLAHLGSRLDVTNDARVHLWYPDRYGFPIPPYRSSEHAISTWPTTASSIGVRRDQRGFVVCAPFGLSDLYGLTVRPNRALIEEVVYRDKTTRWRRQWPRLSVLPW
jgi:uncharacterized protein